jgi:hypothetical protein
VKAERRRLRERDKEIERGEYNKYSVERERDGERERGREKGLGRRGKETQENRTLKWERGTEKGGEDRRVKR